MSPNIKKFIFHTCKELFDFINPALINYQKFNQKLSKQAKVKEYGNIQYNFDVELDRIIIKNLKLFKLGGKIYSEESNFFEFGEKKYRIVYDPFCNSSLASRTFLDAAVGITIFDYDYQFITSTIMDYQTGVIGLVENGKTSFYQVQNKKKISIMAPKVNKLKDAFTVITFENQDERKSLAGADKILHDAKRIVFNSGHLYWLRLAMGNIDAYLDPFGGERLYEMFACTVAMHNGCVVTNQTGEVFEPSKYLKIFEENPDYIFYPIAAGSKQLHGQLLKGLSK